MGNKARLDQVSEYLMADISDLKVAKWKESENRRHSFEMKKLRDEFAKDYQTQVAQNERLMDRMKREYDVEVRNLENELDLKLAEMRKSQEKSLQDENSRLSSEVVNLKKAHSDQVGEIKISQQNEINNLVDSHRRTLEEARQKYIKEKMKYEVS